MANIFLTSKCNLHCPYCFANEFVNKNSRELSYEDFLRVVEFIKRDGTDRIGLIGGEPTLYPDFDKVLETLKNDKDINFVTIYTNGLLIDKYVELIKDEKFSLLVNCNSPKDLKSNYEKLKENIKILADNDINFFLGINLYDENEDFDYIFELLKIAGKKSVRFSVSLTNEEKEEADNIIDTYRKNKPMLFRFLNKCLENEIVPHHDCCSVLHCILTTEEKRLMLKFHLLAKKNDLTGTLTMMRECSPVIDILPDLSAVRCFALSKNIKVPLFSFESLTPLRAFFTRKIDNYAALIFASSECEDCRLRLLAGCPVCIAYKAPKLEKLRGVVREFNK